MSFFEKLKGVFSRREKFFNNKKLVLSFGIGLLINILTWAFLYFKFPAAENPVFLHYNIYFGVDLIGEWYHIFIYLPLVGLAFNFINLALSYIIYNREKVIAYALSGFNIFIQLIIMLAGFLIARQNI